MNPEHEHLLPGRIPWRPIAAVMFGLSCVSATLALRFAITLKPHVFLQTLLAYLIAMLLTLIFFVAYETRRRLLRAHVWLTLMAFTGMLCFIHLDDIPSRVVFVAGQGLLERPSAPELALAVTFDVIIGVLATFHYLWLGRGYRVVLGTCPEEPEAAEGEPASKTKTLEPGEDPEGSGTLPARAEQNTQKDEDETPAPPP